ncbi:MAG: GNAT family N-acetyltransferase [Micromonosporaceae bacterium]|nr:GNAT family N-acetyltransferase [Micromonosporaceae bacterium]
MSVVAVRRVGPDEWRSWREVRLAALTDTPEAFSSTLERELTFDEPTWRQRLDPATGVRVLAVVDEAFAGLVGTYLPEDAPDPELVSMWIRPASRGAGAAGALVAEVLDWARERRHERVKLWVVEDNEPARRLYQRHGFVSTGEFMPYPHHPCLREERMVRAL